MQNAALNGKGSAPPTQGYLLSSTLETRIASSLQQGMVSSGDLLELLHRLSATKIVPTVQLQRLNNLGQRGVSTKQHNCSVFGYYQILIKIIFLIKPKVKVWQLAAGDGLSSWLQMVQVCNCKKAKQTWDKEVCQLKK